jgi:hypothetical protein
MSASLFTQNRFRFYSAGSATQPPVPLVGGKVYFYAAGTTTPKDTYTDEGGLTANTNPVILDGRGEADIWLGLGSYKVVVTNAAGAQQGAAVDNIKTAAQLVSEAVTLLQGEIADLTADLANSTDASKGAGLSGFDFPLNYATKTTGWGIRTAQNLPSLLQYIPVAEWAAILAGTSTTDVTSYIQTALDTGKVHFAPRGKYCVSATTGLTFAAGGGGIVGAGKNHTLFFGILGTGGSSAQIAAYTAGSIFRRAFNPAGTNAYLGAVRLTDLGIILTHPTASITTTAIQVGIDLRNIGRFDIERVHVGNDVPISSFVARAAVPSGYNQQGYGIVTGSVGSSDPAYAGGEVGNIVGCSVWGAFKGIVMDDLVLSPSSASHAVSVTGCDIQGCHSLLAQESSYTAGFVWGRNTLQNVVRQQGNASPTYCMRINGYGNEVTDGGYIEAGACDYLLRLDGASNNNRITLSHYGATSIGIEAISDAGLLNRINCFQDGGSSPGGVDSAGRPVALFDRSYAEFSITCHYNGSAMVVDGGYGMTVTRPTTAGDYLFTFEKPVLSSDQLHFSISSDTNSSGHGGLHAVISRGITNVRVQFYAQNGGVTTAIDPRFVFLKVTNRGAYP